MPVLRGVRGRHGGGCCDVYCSGVVAGGGDLAGDVSLLRGRLRGVQDSKPRFILALRKLRPSLFLRRCRLVACGDSDKVHYSLFSTVVYQVAVCALWM